MLIGSDIEVIFSEGSCNSFFVVLTKAPPLFKLLNLVSEKVNKAYGLYDGSFEGMTCNPEEKKLLTLMRGIKEDLDVITAKSKIIDDLHSDDEMGAMG